MRRRRSLRGRLGLELRARGRRRGDRRTDGRTAGEGVDADADATGADSSKQLPPPPPPTLASPARGFQSNERPLEVCALLCAQSSQFILAAAFARQARPSRSGPTEPTWLNPFACRPPLPLANSAPVRPPVRSFARQFARPPIRPIDPSAAPLRTTKKASSRRAAALPGVCLSSRPAVCAPHRPHRPHRPPVRLLLSGRPASLQASAGHPCACKAALRPARPGRLLPFILGRC